MEITKWTHKEIKNSFTECRTLGDLIKSLESSFDKKGEIICEICVDGMPLTEEQEQTFRANSIEHVKEIIIKSNTQEGLFSESLDSLMSVLEEIEQDCMNGAERFRFVDLKGGQVEFDRMLKKAQLAFDLNSYFSQAAEQYMDAVSKKAIDNRWDVLQKKFFTLSQETSSAFERKDYILVSDLLEYEYTTFLQDWKGWIQQIKGCVR